MNTFGYSDTKIHWYYYTRIEVLQVCQMRSVFTLTSWIPSGISWRAWYILFPGPSRWNITQRVQETCAYSVDLLISLIAQKQRIMTMKTIKQIGLTSFFPDFPEQKQNWNVPMIGRIKCITVKQGFDWLLGNIRGKYSCM